MTSEQKIDASPRNGSRRTGPRSECGKARVSRNALRHGLRSVTFNPGHQPAKIEHVARLIAGDTGGGMRYEQAVIIAESSLLISRIRIFRVKAIERFRARLKSPFFPGSPLPQEFDGRERQHGLGIRLADGDIVMRWCRATEIAIKELKASMKDLRRGDASRLIAFDQRFDSGPTTPRTDPECFLLAHSEMRALERYERRALSRRRRAVRIFDTLS
jgi:hypothetical protein